MKRDSSARMARLINRRLDEGTADSEFWESIGLEGRMEAMWQLVVRRWKAEGRDLRELRFDKSVAVLKRRESVADRRKQARKRQARPRK